MTASEVAGRDSNVRDRLAFRCKIPSHRAGFPHACQKRCSRLGIGALGEADVLEVVRDLRSLRPLSGLELDPLEQVGDEELVTPECRGACSWSILLQLASEIPATVSRVPGSGR
jgi:hypothetical protein